MVINYNLTRKMINDIIVRSFGGYMDFIKMMEDDIKKIEYQINNKDKIDKKNNLIKNLKITKNITKLALPYIIVPFISFSVMSMIHKSPLEFEKIQEKEKIIRLIDSLGQKSTISQYEKYNDVYNVIYHYNKWEYKDGQYERIINKYYLNIKKIKDELCRKSDEEIIEMLNDDSFLKSGFVVNMYEVMIESKEEISWEELNQREFLKIIMYYENDEKFILRKQIVDENLNDFVRYSLITLVLELIVKLLDKKKREKIIQENRKINEGYVPLDINRLQKILSIRKDNLKRLRG